VKDYLDIPVSLIPNALTGNTVDPTGTTPVQFGVKFNASFGVSISQIIFSGDYIVGLQAAKELVSLSEKSLKRTKVETYAAVTKAYYGTIIAKERLSVIDANIDRVKKLFDDTKAMNTAGFVEKLDVDRIELTYNNLLAEKEKLVRYTALSETLLKFQMGYELTSPITLTDVLSPELMIDIDALNQSKVNYEARPEYDMMMSQQNINSLELKANRFRYLPNLAAYGSFQRQAQRSTFDVFDIDKPWFKIGLIGATLNVPIFNGGQKHYKIQQSKIGLAKTANSLEFLKRSIDVEVQTNTMQYKNAIVSLETQRKNKDLAKNIYDTSKIKYDTGVGSNLDIIYAQAAYKEAEINFLSAVYDLILAKTDYLKATGTLVK
jgi:outer membrane protein